MSARLQKVIAAALLGVVFVAGLVSGVALQRRWRGRPEPSRGPGARRHAGRHGKLAAIARELDLSEEQVRRIEEEVLAETRAQHESILRRVCPNIDEARGELDALRGRMSDGLRRNLTPEQRQAYDELRARRRRGRPGAAAHPLGPLLGPAGRPRGGKGGKPTRLESAPTE